MENVSSIQTIPDVFYSSDDESENPECNEPIKKN